METNQYSHTRNKISRRPRKRTSRTTKGITTSFRRSRYINNSKYDDTDNSNTLIIKLGIALSIVTIIGIFKWIDVPFTRNIVEHVKTAVNREFDFDETIGQIKLVESLPDVRAVFGQRDDSQPVDERGDSTKTNNIYFGVPGGGRVISLYGDNKETSVGYGGGGIYIQMTDNDFVYAAQAGEVKLVDGNNEWGELVIINHGNGLESIYGGLGDIKISHGKVVEKGDIIGNVKKNKNDEYILLFEIWDNGNTVNPLDYIDTNSRAEN